MCRDLLPTDFQPSFFNDVTLLLSQNKTLFLITWPWALKKFLIQNASKDVSFISTDFASVKLLMFNFCFVDAVLMASVLIVIDSPVWLLKSLCTANAAFAYHLIMWVSSAFRVCFSSFVFFEWLNNSTSFFQSFMFGSLTSVHENAIAVCVSDLPLLHANKPCAAIAWKCSLNFLVSFEQSSLTSNE